MAGLALLAMAVVLIAGVVALGAQGSRTTTTPQTPVAPAAAMFPAETRARQDPAASADMWVVQVGAFMNHARSQSLVERLNNSGFPTFAISRPAPSGRLNVVRVGPFRAASEADDALARLHELAELRSAFVRSVTSIP
jgi:cell division septation protein DedD